MFRRINLFRTFLGPVSTLEKRAGPVSIKEINWPFSPTRTKPLPTLFPPKGPSPVSSNRRISSSPANRISLFIRQDFSPPTRIIFSCRSGGLSPESKWISCLDGDESDSGLACCCLLTGGRGVGGAPMVIPGGALIDASPDQTLTL